MAQDHLVDACGIDLRPGDDLGDQAGRERGGMLILQRAAEAADRRAQGFTYDDVRLVVHESAFHGEDVPPTFAPPH